MQKTPLAIWVFDICYVSIEKKRDYDILMTIIDEPQYRQ